jgi:hypothetical protein
MQEKKKKLPAKDDFFIATALLASTIKHLCCITISPFSPLTGSAAPFLTIFVSIEDAYFCE